MGETTFERKLVIPAPAGGKITDVKISDDKKSVEITSICEAFKDPNKEFKDFDKAFPIIDPSELINHDLLKHNPVGYRRQEALMADIRKVIEMELPAFRIPCMDPSEENEQIVFKSGNKPAVNHSPYWWEVKFKNFMINKNSRFGTDLHWAAFMGKLMKYLIEEKNYPVEEAWRAVCGDSIELGHYRNSDNATIGFEPTGSRPVGHFFDLANTTKIIKKSGTATFLLMGGNCYLHSYRCPLMDASDVKDLNSTISEGVGWMVLDV